MLKVLVLSSAVLATACGKKSDDTTAVAQSKMTIKGGASLTLGGNASKATMTINEFLVSKSDTCSDPVLIYKSDEGKVVDMMAGPEIGSGSIGNGTYPCIMLVMSDNISFTPETTSGACVAETAYTIDVFRPQGETYKPTGTLPDGTAVSGTTEKQKMAIYISTLSTTSGGDGSNPFAPPTATATTNGIKLTNALVVSADVTGTFVMDSAGKIGPNGSECDMQPPTFGFK